MLLCVITNLVLFSGLITSEMFRNTWLLALSCLPSMLAIPGFLVLVPRVPVISLWLPNFVYG